MLRAFRLSEDGRGGKAYAGYLEARAKDRNGVVSDKAMAELRRGWCLGEATFGEKVLEAIKAAVGGERKKSSVGGAAAKAHDEAEAERLVVAALAWLVTGKGETVVSALIGAAVVVVPGALLARGMTGAPGANPGTVVLRFMVWELVKIVVAVAMLVAAARLVPNLSWLAVLAAMVVCLKVNGAALLWRGRVKQTQTVAAGDR